MYEDDGCRLYILVYVTFNTNRKFNRAKFQTEIKKVVKIFLARAIRRAAPGNRYVDVRFRANGDTRGWIGSDF